MLTPQSVSKQISQGELEPVYYLQGTENYFIEQIERVLLTQFAMVDENDVTKYDLNEISIQDVLVDAETLPFFSEKKLIIVTNPSFLTAERANIQVKHHTEHLQAYLEHPAPYTTLVIIAPYEKVDGRRSIVKAIKKHAINVDCDPVNERNLRKWIASLANEQKISLTDEAIYLLEAECSNNLYLIQQEMMKISLFIGSEQEVTRNDIAEIISASPTFSAFELTDAVLNKDLHEAIKIYSGLEKRNEDPIGLIALLAYQFRIIYQVMLLKEKGYSTNQMQRIVQTHPYAIQLALRRSSQYTAERLAMIIEKLTETDAKIKRGLLEKKIAFQLLLYELISV